MTDESFHSESGITPEPGHYAWAVDDEGPWNNTGCTSHAMAAAEARAEIEDTDDEDRVVYTAKVTYFRDQLLLRGWLLRQAIEDSFEDLGFDDELTPTTPEFEEDLARSVQALLFDLVKRHSKHTDLATNYTLDGKIIEHWPEGSITTGSEGVTE